MKTRKLNLNYLKVKRLCKIIRRQRLATSVELKGSYARKEEFKTER